ncbi:MAG: phage tail family protein [Actinomycetia bacterium]|nr:phage tail family protein [Actinomycetes bacterium]
MTTNVIARFTLGSKTDQDLGIQLRAGIGLPILPSARDRQMVVAGKRGVWDFGADMAEARIVLPCTAVDATTQAGLQTTLRALAAHLLDGDGEPEEMEFSVSWDSGKYWTVRYGGVQNVTRRPTTADFDLVLLASDPFAHSATVTTTATITTDPQTVTVTNSGNVNTPGTITLTNNTGSTISGFTLTKVT